MNAQTPAIPADATPVMVQFFEAKARQPDALVFFRMGEVILELIGQVDTAGQGAPGFFGLAITVDDVDALAHLLGEHLGRPKDAVQEGRRIATLRHREVGMSVATAFMSPDPPNR